MATSLLADIAQMVEELGARQGAAFDLMRRQLGQGHGVLTAAVEFVVANAKCDPNAVFAGSVAYLKLAGIVLGGWQMARALLVAVEKRAEDQLFYDAKVATAQCFAEHVLPQAAALEASITSAKDREGALALSEDQL